MLHIDAMNHHQTKSGSMLDIKEPDGTSERTYASVVNGKAKRKVDWENLA